MSKKKYYHPQHDFYNKRGMTVPETISHGTEEDIHSKLEPVEASNWRMEGPGQLVADTDVGRLVQFISPDYICTGTDKEGLPILAKIGE